MVYGNCLNGIKIHLNNDLNNNHRIEQSGALGFKTPLCYVLYVRQMKLVVLIKELANSIYF